MVVSSCSNRRRRRSGSSRAITVSSSSSRRSSSSRAMVLGSRSSSCRSSSSSSRSGFFFPLLLLFLLYPPLSSSQSHDLVSQLLQKQDLSPDGVIRLDDHDVLRFIQQAQPRPYSLIIFFDALHLRDNPELRLEDLRREFGILASSYIQNNEGSESASKVFFVDLEFKQSETSFKLFGVSSLPRVKHLGPGNVSPKDADVMDQSGFSRGAESMASFVESKTKQKVGPIERPSPFTKTQLLILAGALLATAPFVIKKVMTEDTPLHDPKLWCSFAIFVYFFSVSGSMHNIIRGVPLFLPDKNNPGKLLFFYQASGMQFGAEGFVVGFLYTLVGLVLAFITHFLVEVKSQTRQRLALFVGFAMSYWAVKEVISLDNWKTGYGIHAFWPRRWG